MKELLLRIWERVRVIFGTIHPEAVELLSIGFALSWVLPLVKNPWFMSQSPFLAAVQEHLPRPWIFGICSVLLISQCVAMLMGGEPPILESDRRRARQWLWVRLSGQLLAAGVWFFLALLIAVNGVLTPGAIQHALVAVACAVGVWRFYYLIRENRNIEKQVLKQQGEMRLLLAKG